jgi:hypothetical protein
VSVVQLPPKIVYEQPVVKVVKADVEAVAEMMQNKEQTIDNLPL